MGISEAGRRHLATSLAQTVGRGERLEELRLAPQWARPATPVPQPIRVTPYRWRGGNAPRDNGVELRHLGDCHRLDRLARRHGREQIRAKFGHRPARRHAALKHPTLTSGSAHGENRAAGPDANAPSRPSRLAELGLPRVIRLALTPRCVQISQRQACSRRASMWDHCRGTVRPSR